jgi:hypothetical protein
MANGASGAFLQVRYRPGTDIPLLNLNVRIHPPRVMRRSSGQQRSVR